MCGTQLSPFATSRVNAWGPRRQFRGTNNAELSPHTAFGLSDCSAAQAFTLAPDCRRSGPPPVVERVSSDSISAALNFGRAASSSAATPETSAAAIELPDATS